MTVRSRKANGDLGPETVARMSIRDLSIIIGALLAATISICGFLFLLKAQVQSLDHRVARLESQEDARNSR
jgi:hypothetical protein